MLTLTNPRLRIYLLIDVDENARFVFDDSDGCYRFAREFGLGFFTHDIEAQERVDRLHMGASRLRDLKKEPHPAAKRGCVVQGEGVWPEEEFPFV